MEEMTTVPTLFQVHSVDVVADIRETGGKLTYSPEMVPISCPSSEVQHAVLTGEGWSIMNSPKS